MYEAHFGLQEKPFSLLPDPDYLFLSEQHRMALAMLEYSIVNQAGFCAITGETGTGKTTLIRRLLGQLDERVTVGLISNTHRSFDELLRWILMAFGLEYQPREKAELHQILVDYLIKQYAGDRTTVIIVDEAQNLSPDTLEELRMLSNINSDKHQVLQIILAGQPPLRQTLERDDLRQFAQRIAVDYHLRPLDGEETRRYVAHRLTVAGGPDDIFTPAACDSVYRYTGGTPRLINLLCDTALVYAYAEQSRRVDAPMVEEVVRERVAHGVLPTFLSAMPTAAANGDDVGAEEFRDALGEPEVDIETETVKDEGITGLEDSQNDVATAAVSRRGVATLGERARPAPRIAVLDMNARREAVSPLAGGTGVAADGASPRAHRREVAADEVPRRRRSDVAAVPGVDAGDGRGNTDVGEGGDPGDGGARDDAVTATATPPFTTDVDSAEPYPPRRKSARAARATGDDAGESIRDRVTALDTRARDGEAAATAVATPSAPRRGGFPAFASGAALSAAIAVLVLVVLRDDQLINALSGGTQGPRAAAPAIATPPPAMDGSTANSAATNDASRLLEILQRERDAALAQARALKHERDAAVAAAQAEATLRTAERQVAELRRLEREAARKAAEAERQLRQAKASLHPRSTPTALPPPAPAAQSAEVLPAVATDDGSAADPRADAPAPDDSPAPTDAGAGHPVRFSANPCKGPSAKFLSTCKE